MVQQSVAWHRGRRTDSRNSGGRQRQIKTSTVEARAGADCLHSASEVPNGVPTVLGWGFHGAIYFFLKHANCSLGDSKEAQNTHFNSARAL